jgi:predicted SAM-dependent methyltransferase
MSPSALASKTGVEGPLCLNLGGAGEGFLDGRIDGFLTVDLRDSPSTDIVCDCSTLTRFGDGTVETVYASNILEHFPMDRTLSVLKEWQRVLKPGGHLYVSVPDFHRAVEMYQKHGLTEWLRFHLWGDQKHPLNYHYTCFTFATLAKDLLDAGFHGIKRVSEWPFKVKDGSRNVDSIDGKLISLNMAATK